jgi:hypothetical protein
MTPSSSISKLIKTPPMFNGQNRSQTEAWVATFKAYLHVNRRSFDDEDLTTETTVHGSPNVNFTNEDSLSRVLIVLSRLEGEAAEWANVQHQKWSTQPKETWVAATTHHHGVVRNVPMDMFWNEFLQEWGDV